MEAKKILQIVQPAIDEYCTVTKIKKKSFKAVDVEARIENPCSHDQYIPAKVTGKDRIALKLFCAMVDYIKAA